MSENSARVIKVKVSPYPISFTIGQAPNVVRGKILKLTKKGFLGEVEDPHMTVREKFIVQFTLPVIGFECTEPVVVVKSYDKLASKTETGSVVQRLLEFHFLNLKLKNLEEIEKFLRQIGQIK